MPLALLEKKSFVAKASHLADSSWVFVMSNGVNLINGQVIFISRSTPGRPGVDPGSTLAMVACCSWPETKAANIKLEGYCFTDGSSDRHVIKECGRAGWSAIQTDVQGNLVAGVWGPVPSQLLQSPQAAEHFGFTMLMMLLGGLATAGCDCSNVIRSLHRGKKAADDIKATYSGLVREAQNATNAEMMQDVFWVKGHQSLARASASGCPDTLRNAKGNDLADKAADRGRLCHDAPSDQMEWRSMQNAASKSSQPPCHSGQDLPEPRSEVQSCAEKDGRTKHLRVATNTSGYWRRSAMTTGSGTARSA